MESRTEDRYSVNESVVVSILDKPETHRPATVIDVSESGFRLTSGLNLTPGSRILTTLNSVAIFGVVRNCQRSGDNLFLAGVQITDVVPAV
jgi:PilZ domain-containing protein